MKYIEIGKIQNTHGLKGELKIKAYTDFERFEKGNYVYIHYNGEYIKMIVNSKRESNDLILVAFKDNLDINLVEKYKGSFVYIDETQQDELDDGEYYIEDLIGMECVNQNNEYIGKVINVRDLPQGYILEIKRDGKKNGLVPFVDEFIIDVDEKIVINEIEGLLWK